MHGAIAEGKLNKEKVYLYPLIPTFSLREKGLYS
jgi:hypothetical protein